MTMRVTLERNFAFDDPYGHKGPSDWQVVNTIPCYCWAGNPSTNFGDVVVAETGQPQMIVPKNIDIQNTDRVSAVRDRRGNELFGQMFVDSVARRADHLAIGLKSNV